MTGTYLPSITEAKRRFSESEPNSWHAALLVVCLCLSLETVYTYGLLETVADFIFLGSKITADGDCSHEIKRRLLLGRKAMTNPGCILKTRDIILLIKVCLVKAMLFPVVMYGFESWTIKKAEC